MRILLRKQLGEGASLSLEWKYQDMWLGAFWLTRYTEGDFSPMYRVFELWVCLLPCLPIHFRTTTYIRKALCHA